MNMATGLPAELMNVFTDPFARIGYKMNLLLTTGQMLMESGADTNRIARDMKRAAAFMGIPEEMINLHIMYTTLMLNISDENHSHTCFRKCQIHGVNMNVISAISKLSWRAMEQKYTLEKFESELVRISNLGRHYAPVFTMVAAGLACGGFCRLFGCDWLAFFWTALCAMVGFFVRQQCNKWEINTYAGISIAAFVATYLAYLTHFFSGSQTPWHPMIACTLFIVPGIPLINAVADMLNNYIVAGTTRAINTLLICSGMTFGILVAIRLGNVEHFTSLSLMPESVYLEHALAAAIAAMGFSVIFNIPPRLLLPAAIGAMISVCLRNFLNFGLGLGPVIGSFIGAVTVSLLALQAIKYVHWLRTPIHVLTTPSVIPMIPGVLLYRLLMALVNIKGLDTGTLLEAISNGVDAVLIIVSIAVGVAVPNIFAHHYLERSKQMHLEELLADMRAYMDRDD